MKHTSKIRKKLRTIGNIIFYVIVGSLIVVALSNGIDRFTGYKFPFFSLHSAVVVTDSMSRKNETNTYLDDSMKQYQKFDLITFQEIKYEDIKVYDVVAYYYDDMLVVHRVIDKYTKLDESGTEKQFLVTKGDANINIDTPFESSLVRGKVIWSVPKIGYIFAFTGTFYFWIGFFVAMFFLLLGIYIYKYGKVEDKKITYVEESAINQNKAKYINEEENVISEVSSCKIEKQNYKCKTYFSKNKKGDASSVLLQIYEEEYEGR